MKTLTAIRKFIYEITHKEEIAKEQARMKRKSERKAFKQEWMKECIKVASIRLDNNYQVIENSNYSIG